jgi:subtilase family serine protease
MFYLSRYCTEKLQNCPAKRTFRNGSWQVIAAQVNNEATALDSSNRSLVVLKQPRFKGEGC